VVVSATLGGVISGAITGPLTLKKSLGRNIGTNVLGTLVSRAVESGSGSLLGADQKSWHDGLGLSLVLDVAFGIRAPFNMSNDIVRTLANAGAKETGKWASNQIWAGMSSLGNGSGTGSGTSSQPDELLWGR